VSEILSGVALKMDWWQAVICFAAGLLCGLLARRQGLRTRIESDLAEARTDGLTGLVNRRGLDAQLADWFAGPESVRAPWVLAMIDIDRFKEVNDTHGHLAGDEVLKWTAKTFQAWFSDAILISRYGGEEFALILPGGLARASESVDSLRRRVADQAIDVAVAQVRITFSAGLSQATTSGGARQLVHETDEALYAAKKAGRNRVFVSVQGKPVPWDAGAPCGVG